MWKSLAGCQRIQTQNEPQNPPPSHPGRRPCSLFAFRSPLLCDSMAKSKHPRRQKTRPQHAVALPPREGPRPDSPKGSSRGLRQRPLMLWGIHAVRAALANPDRCIAAGWATRSAQAELGGAPDRSWTTVTTAQLAAQLPADAVHQGVAIEADPLPEVPLGSVLSSSAKPGPLVILDQVTDPHNVGAILRSCAVFGAAALITTERHAPPESGALAKAAAGALDVVPWVRVGNLAQALAATREAGRWVAGLDGGAEETIAGAGLAGSNSKTALVLGAEGKGLRRLTKENCDVLVRIPLQYANNEKCANLIDSLNVSNAAAVALYELCSD